MEDHSHTRFSGTTQECKGSPAHDGSLWLSKPFSKTKNRFHTSPEMHKDSGFTKADLTSCELTWNMGFFLVCGQVFWQVVADRAGRTSGVLLVIKHLFFSIFFFLIYVWSIIITLVFCKS